MNEKSKAYQEAGLAHMRIPDEQMIQKLIDDPKLMVQPLIRSGNTLSIGWNEQVWKSWYRKIKRNDLKIHDLRPDVEALFQILTPCGFSKILGRMPFATKIVYELAMTKNPSSRFVLLLGRVHPFLTHRRLRLPK